MTPARLRIAGLALAAAIYLTDRGVKGWLLDTAKLRDVRLIELLPFFDLRYTENHGVSLGLLTADSTEMRWLLVALTSAIACGVVVWLLRERNRFDIAGLAMVLGGALGNIHDRVRFGYVFDYADLHIGEFRPFLIFNIADAAITIGVVIILARSLFSREKPQSAEPGNGGDTAPEN
jgi:signal peptidase II